MAEHKGRTDEAKKVKLESSIQQVYWTRRVAVPGGTVGIEVYTRNVGNGTDLEITIREQSGKTHGTFKDRISGNHFWAEYRVPADAKESLVATVKLPKHSLEEKSPSLALTPPLRVTNIAWDRDEATRGDILHLTAEIHGAPDGAEAIVGIFEHDEEGADELVTRFPVIITRGKVDAEWEFSYHDETSSIPTHAEMQEHNRSYDPPQFFWTPEVYGFRPENARSGLLRFVDRLEVHVTSALGDPLRDTEVVAAFADGTSARVRSDENGIARFDNAPPGPVDIGYDDENLAAEQA